MKLAVSNISWQPDEDDIAIEVLSTAGISAIEVAPSVVWPDPLRVSEREARRWAEDWRKKGFEIVACQSLLFGHPELMVFGAQDVRSATLEYLSSMIRLGGWLGAGALVFGSPANRRSAGMSTSDRDRIATEFFRSAGEVAFSANTILCIEPNPTEYGSDWICSVAEGAAFVESVAHAGIGLHLDAGAIHLGGDSAASIDAALRHPGVRHAHASEPFLAPLGTTEPTRPLHERLSVSLRDSGYTGYVSLEMRRRPDVNRADEMQSAVSHLRSWYGG